MKDASYKERERKSIVFATDRGEFGFESPLALGRLGEPREETQRERRERQRERERGGGGGGGRGRGREREELMLVRLGQGGELFMFIVPITDVLTEIDPNPSAKQLSILQGRHSLFGTLDVGELGVGKASRLAGASVNGHTNVDDVFDFDEDLVEILIGQVIGQVAEKQRS